MTVPLITTSANASSNSGDNEEQLAAPLVDFEILFGARIPLSDGVSLSGNIYLAPHPRAPSPVIFAMTPYSASNLHPHASYFAARGYSFLAIDVRGRGNSDGDFDPMINEGCDGAQVANWIASQAFCDGQVAMWGGSYLGYAQWPIAALRPPALSTIVPVAPAYPSVDVPFRNNIPKPYFIQWLSYVFGRTNQDQIFLDHAYWRRRYRQWFESGKSFLELDTFLGIQSTVFQKWMAHPSKSDWWDRYNPSAEQYASISIPVLTITGMCDTDQPGALAHYRQHITNAGVEAASRHFLVIGPWDHAGTRDPKLSFLGIEAGPASMVDLLQLHLEWYDWVMRGGARPAFLRDAVTYYVLGADEWRSAPSLEAVASEHQELWLDATSQESKGTLSSAPAIGRRSSQYVHDPRDLSWTATDCEVDPEMRAGPSLTRDTPGKHVIFESGQFSTDTDVSGIFSLSAWISIDQPDADFRAWIYEITADGAAVLLTFDSMRARYRKDAREAELIDTAAPLRYDFDHFLFASKRIAAGSRLRLTIGPIHSIYAQKNHNSGGIVAEETVEDARVVTVKVYHDRRRPSKLLIPIDRRREHGT